MTVHVKGVQNGPHVTVNQNVKNVSVPGGHSLPLYIRGCAAGQGIVFLPLCPKQGI